MSRQPNYFRFIRDNLPFLATGFLLSFLSSFGQTFFISIFGGEIREAYGLTNGEWGLTYMIGTGASAVVMVFAGGLADRFRVRTLGIVVVLLLASACLFMAFNAIVALLPFVIFALRFTGQGMTTHVATVAMSRWFIATRGRALAVAAFGFMLGEAALPLTMVWLKSMIEWRTLWVCFAVFCVLACFVLYRLLRLERTPQSMGETAQSTGMEGRHWTRSEALRHPLFWAMVPAVMSFSGFGTAFWFHQVHFAEIKGWSHLALVSVFPLGTAALLISTIGYGWAVDRFGATRLLPIYLIPLVIAFILHWYAPSLGWTALAVMLMGIAGGGQATLLNACWAEFYGTRHIGAIKAAAAALMVLGSAIGPGLSGWLIDEGIGFEQQQLGYAATFAFAALILIIPTRKARQALAVSL
ncbi:MFS transporter [Loktanella sp. 5RATIMAR09]|uniref:MFS transporter n=1 Tax=Loktanella sp. 5RATIMAR09 TaxID=1225655 RepID=UPI0006EBA341|nr:MFS transporter [Loktanella sp. 5RATIMAR09]KQI73566.1 MFS transporter [Loktanella sp. 5RATIMAR09]